MTASGHFGGTGSAGGGCFLLSSSCSSGAVSAAIPRSAATKCRSARSSSSSSSSTILSMMGGLSVRNGTGRGGPSSALSSVTRSARIRPRSYSTTPAVRQQHPKQAGGQKRSQSTIIGVPGGPQAGGAGDGAGNAAGRGAGGGTSTGGAGAGAGSMLGGALPPQAAQATWKEIFNLLRERCRVFLLKPRRLVSRIASAADSFLYIHLFVKNIAISHAFPFLLLLYYLPYSHTQPIPRWIAPKIYTITFSEILGHSSFILVAASYATDDFITLRSIAVIGSTAMLAFTYFHPHGQVLWLPFKWNVLFIAINSYRLGLIMYQQYLTDMMPEVSSLTARSFA